MPLQVSGLSHSVSLGLPQAVVAALKPLSVQLPAPSHLSWLVHSASASPQLVPTSSWWGKHAAEMPLQVSGLSHCVALGLPQAVVLALKPLSVQLPLPSHLSWLVHSASASPQLVPAASWFVWQVPLPSQVSALSHALVLLLPQAVPAAVGGLEHRPVLVSQVPATWH